MAYMVDNRYLVGEQLGVGGMGAVYRGKDTRLQRDVAIKRLNILGGKAEVDQFMKRFEREAIAMAQLQHPNIVRVLDFGRDDEGIFLILEFMSGRSLKERMTAPFDPRTAATLLAPIADALHYVHERGMIHRDVKPGNILFDARGNPMLADFGIVKLVEESPGATLTATGMAVGTPTYMAPELIGGEFDHRADQYALGIIFYEMVTGKPPFKGRTPMEAMVAHKYEPLPDPRLLCPGLPQDAWDLIVRVLAKDPEQRYEDSGQFSAALRRLGQPPAPTPQPQPKPGEEPTSLVEDELPFNLPAETPQPPAPGMQAVSEEDETQGIRTPARGLPLAQPQYHWEPQPAASVQPAPPTPAAVAAKKTIPAWAWVLGGVGLFTMATLVVVVVLILRGKFMVPAATEEPYAFEAATEAPMAAAEETATQAPTEAPTASMVLSGGVITAANVDQLQPASIFGKGGDHLPLFTPDGRFLLLGNTDGLYVFDAVSGVEISHTPGRYITAMVLSPDGSALATLDYSGYLSLWSIGDGSAPYLFQAYQYLGGNNWDLRALAWSPDGSVIAFSDAYTIYYYSVEKNDVFNTAYWENSLIRDLAYSPDGNLVYAAANNLALVGVWIAETSTLYTTIPVNYPYYIDLSPDGTRLAVFDAEEYSLKLFSLSSYLLERAYSVDGYMNEMRFSPDGTALYAVLSNGQVNRWEVGGSDQPLTRQLPEGYGTRFSLSPGGCLAAWSNWLRVGTYDLCQGSPGFSLDAFTTRGNPVTGWVNDELLFSDTESQPGRVLIRDIFGDVRHVLDISSYNTWMYPVSISPDGTTLVGGVYYQNTYNILLFDLASESLLGMFAVDEYPYDLRFAPDSQSFVYCGSSLTRIYNMHNWWEGPFYSLDGLEYMQVGKYFPAYDLLVLGQFAKVQLVSPASGERFELPVPGGYVEGIALSADGSRVYVASGRSLYVYDRRTGAFVAQAPDSLPTEGYALALNGSETLLAVGDTQGAIHLFDAQNLGWVRTLYRHTYGMADLQFAPDDRALTSTGWDALSVVWAVP